MARGWDGSRGLGRGPGLAAGVEHAQAAGTADEGPPGAERRLGLLPALARPILSTGLPVAP